VCTGPASRLFLAVSSGSSETAVLPSVERAVSTLLLRTEMVATNY